MNYKHGCSFYADRNARNPKWRAYCSWAGMKSRCTNPNNKQFADWGGRGITYDPRWESFDNFFADMGERPAGTMLERSDNDGPYCKANCRWATRAEQNRNKRNNRYLEYDGRRMLAVDWAKHLGVAPRLIRVRLNRGWSVERTLSTPVAA